MVLLKSQGKTNIALKKLFSRLLSYIFIALHVHVPTTYNTRGLTFGVRALASWGPANPGMVPTVFVIPMRMPANLGAMSMWLMT